MRKHKFVDWFEVITICKTFTQTCNDRNINDFTDIVAIARGGLIPAQILAYRMKIPKIHSYGIKFYKDERLDDDPIVYQTPEEVFSDGHILVVDEVCDSGKTFEYVIDDLLSNNPASTVTTFCLHYKPCSTYKPDFVGETVDSKIWIDYPWDKE